MSKATPREVSPPPIEQPDVLVRFLKHGLLECGDLAVPGECRTLPAAEAAIHIGAHRAVLGGVRCRALESHCADRTWREAGAEFDLPTELAVSLHRYGRLAVMDPSSLPAKITLPDVLPRPVRTPPVDPWASIPRVPVKVLRPFAAAGEAFAPIQLAGSGCLRLLLFARLLPRRRKCRSPFAQRLGTPARV